MQQKTLENLKNFSDRLKTVLNGLSQTDVAQRIDVSQNTISCWLRGDLPQQFNSLCRLAVEFNIDLNWLLLGNSSESAKKAIRALKPFAKDGLTPITDKIKELNEKKWELIQKGAVDLSGYSISRDLLETEVKWQERVKAFKPLKVKEFTAEKQKYSEYLKEIQLQLDNLCDYYNAVTTTLNELMKPFGEQM